MSTLIIIVLYGLAFAYFATQNTAGVVVKLGDYIWTLPLYVVAFGSLLAGLLVSWIISVINSLLDWSEGRKMETAYQDTRQTVYDLSKRVHDLELENTHLRTLVNERPVQKTEVTEEKPKGFFRRLRHNPSF